MLLLQKFIPCFPQNLMAHILLFADCMTTNVRCITLFSTLVGQLIIHLKLRHSSLNTSATNTVDVINSALSNIPHVLNWLTNTTLHNYNFHSHHWLLLYHDADNDEVITYTSHLLYRNPIGHYVFLFEIRTIDTTPSGCGLGRRCAASIILFHPLGYYTCKYKSCLS